jgi:hypothetical protein
MKNAWSPERSECPCTKSDSSVVLGRGQALSRIQRFPSAAVQFAETLPRRDSKWRITSPSRSIDKFKILAANSLPMALLEG